MIRKKILAGLLCIAAAVSGCGSSEYVAKIEDKENPGEEIKLTFFGNKYEAENVVVIEQILNGFMEENPDINITYESLKGTDYYAALEKRVNAGMGDDIFMVNHDTVLEFTKKGYLEELSGLDTILSFSESALDQMRQEDGIYFVPTSVSAFGLYCNMPMLKKHGQKVPGTLEEFEEVCSYFTGLGIVPVVANNDISIKTMAMARSFYPVYQENRADQVFRQINKGAQLPGAYLSAGYQMMEDFCSRGYIDREEALVTKKTSGDLELFAKGDRPFMITGAWAAGRVKRMNPDLKFEVHPYPVQQDEPVLVLNMDTRLSINADSPHVEEARRFVTYFTRQDNIHKFIDNQASFSPLVQAYEPSTVEIQPLAECMAEGRTMLGADDRLEIPIWNLTAEASKRLLSGESVEDIMRWLNSQAGTAQRDEGV